MPRQLPEAVAVRDLCDLALDGVLLALMHRGGNPFKKYRPLAAEYVGNNTVSVQRTGVTPVGER